MPNGRVMDDDPVYGHGGTKEQEEQKMIKDYPKLKRIQETLGEYLVSDGDFGAWTCVVEAYDDYNEDE